MGSFRPVTGAGGVVPGTGMRMTTAQRQAGPGVGMMTDVKVTDRPMTMQGVMGMKTGSMGPGRQIYDKSYYMSELRKKIASLNTEIQKLNQEIGEIQNDANLYG